MARLITVLWLIVSAATFTTSAAVKLPVEASFAADGSYSVAVGSGITIPSGELALRANSTWFHSGIGGLQSLGITSSSGSDSLGTFSRSATRWAIGTSNAPVLLTEIRQYDGDMPAVVFNATILVDLSGTATSGAEVADPVLNFPALDMQSGWLQDVSWAAFRGVQPMKTGVRMTAGAGPYGHGASYPATVLFSPMRRDGDGQLRTTALAVAAMTPATRFASAAGEVDHTWKMGIASTVTTLPAGTTQAVMFTAATSVNEAMYSLGSAYRAFYADAAAAHEKVLATDPTVTTVGAWADNGAYLNMNKFIGNLNLPYDPLDPDRSPQTLVTKLVTGLHALGVPVSYVQLDDWYYAGKVAEGAVSCVDDWDDARPDWFPAGLKGLSSAMGGNVSIMGYIPWVCSTAKYFTEGNFTPILAAQPAPAGIPGNGGGISQPCPWPTNLSCLVAKAVPDPAQSEAFYARLLSAQAAKGVAVFEQDFVGAQCDEYGFNASATLAEQWLVGQHAAAASLGIPVQQCLASAGTILLAAAKLPFVTNARASGDYAGCTGYAIAGSGLFLDAMGVRPFHDNLWTVSDQPGNPYTNTTLMPQQYAHCPQDPYRQPNPELDVLTAALSTGPFGIGDGPGLTDAGLVMQAVRADGRILRPDRHASPSELSFADRLGPSDAGDTAALQPNTTRLDVSSVTLAITGRAAGASLTAYFALAIDLPQSFGVTFAPGRDNAFPAPSQAAFRPVQWARHAECRAGCMAGQPGCCAGAAVSDAAPLPVFTSPGGVNPANGTHPFTLTALAPVDSESGWALLGEEGKVVRLSRDRIDGVSFSGNGGTGAGVQVQIRGAAGEAVAMAAVDPTGVVRLGSTVIGSGGTATLSIS